MKFLFLPYFSIALLSTALTILIARWFHPALFSPASITITFLLAVLALALSLIKASTKSS